MLKQSLPNYWVNMSFQHIAIENAKTVSGCDVCAKLGGKNRGNYQAFQQRES